MKHNFIKKLIATSVITSSIFSICPTTTFATGVNYSGVGQTRGQWSKQGENWYYYLGGQIQKGWIYDITGWYYTDQKGVMQTGVIQIGGKIYLFADSGVMQTGNVVINGKVYTAGEDGAFYGDELPMPVKAFDWFGADDNVKHPSQVIDSDKDNSSSTNPTIAYDPLAKKEKFQIIFKDEDGEDLKIRNVEDGDSVSLYKPTKKGYKFVEWNTKKNGNGDSYDYDEDVKITKDLKLYAVWEEIEVTDENAEELGIVKVEDITIVSEDKKKEITTDKGTLKLSVDILPVNADNKKVSWSVENETGKATISDKGLLTAEEDGVVIVKATAKDGSEVTDSMRITISGQTSGSGSGEGGTGSGSGSGEGGSGSGTGSGSGSGNTDAELPVIIGEDILVDNNTSAELMKGNTYSTVRIATNGNSPVLQNIKANKIIINGDDDIILDNCQVNYIEVLRPGSNATLTLRNGSTVQVVNIERGITVAGTGYNKVNVKTDEVVTINSGAVVNTLNLTELNSKVKLDGKVSTMNIASGAVGSMIDGSGSIDKLVNDAINVKLSVSSVGSISGTVAVENTGSTDLIKYAKELEEITKEVEAAEKVNSTDNSALLDKINKKIADNDPYKSEYENLKFRIEQLNKNNTSAATLKEARSYVSALEQVSKYDPTSTIEFKVYINSDGLVKVAITGDDTSIYIPENLVGEFKSDELRELALNKVKQLSLELIDRQNLENRITNVDDTIKQGAKLKSMVDTITTSSAVEFKADDYNAIGIDINNSYVTIANTYVSLLHDKKDAEGNLLLKPTSDVVATDDNISAMVTVLDNDKSLIKAQVSQATSIMSIKQKLEEDIKSFNDYIRNNGLDTGVEVTMTKLEVLRDKYNSISEALKKLQKEIDDRNIDENDLKLRDENGNPIELAATENKCKDELSKYTLKFMDKNINSLYSGTIVNEGAFTGDINSAKISASLIESAITEARSALNTIRNSYTDVVLNNQIQTYMTAIEKADTQLKEVKKVLDALNGGIKSGGTVAKRTANGYELLVRIPTTGYTIDAENCIVTAGSFAPKFNVVTATGGAVELQMKTNVESADAAYTVSGAGLNIDNKIGSLIITGVSPNKQGTIRFEELNYSTGFDVKDATGNTYYFNVRVTGKIISSEYVYSVTVSRS